MTIGNENNIVNLRSLLQKVIHDLNKYIKVKVCRNYGVDFNLSLFHICCLYKIKESGTTTATKLNSEFCFNKENLNYAIQKLMKLNLIHGCRSDIDKRFVMLEITKLGNEVCDTFNNIDHKMFSGTEETNPLLAAMIPLKLHCLRFIEFIEGDIDND